jgi:predicted nuclease of restriction endonuclease-like (RecB) superfamily
MTQLIPVQPDLLSEVKQLISDAKQRAVVAVNAELTLLYWKVGKRIAVEVLQGERAEYGQQIITKLAQDLTMNFGRGWTKKTLHHCLRFAQCYSEHEIVSAVQRQLSWTHFKSLIYIDNPMKREFYLTMAVQERWSTRTLAERIDKQLFERTAISRKPELTIENELKHLREQGSVSEDLILKDPYVLDFLDLNDSYLEKDLEDAILRELQEFLLELGSGFSFVARQFRIQVDDDDFYLDLLFYNRKLKRLVAIDLKSGNFKAEYKGQMELYLRWLAKHEQEPDELPPLGIILCTGKKQEQIELLELDSAGIHVAEYLTVLPPKAVFAQRMELAIKNAKQHLDYKNDQNDQSDKDEQE